MSVATAPKVIDSLDNATDNLSQSDLSTILRDSIKGLGRYVLISVLSAVVIVPFILGPTTSQRDQNVLAEELATRFAQAASAAGTDDLSPLPIQAFAQGSPVAIIEISKLGVQSVVIEGSSSRDTSRAIGHLFGSSGPGQEGNAVLVGRSAAFGAGFKDINTLADGDKITISTIQGNTEYVVDSSLEIPSGGPLGATSDNRLTLVTGDPKLMSSSLFAVSASMVSNPYIAYPQNPSWLASHPLGDQGLPLAQLILLLSVVSVIGISFRISLFYFSKVTVYSIFFPIFLAQSILVARTVFDFLPPVL